MQKKAADFNLVLKQLRLMGKLSAVFIIICFMVLFQNASYGIGMFLVLLAYFVFFYRRKVRLYQRELKSTILAESLRPILGTISFQVRDKRAAQAVAQSGFLPLDRPRSLVVRDTVRGICRGYPAFLTDVTANYITSESSRRGKAVQVLEPLAGCYFELELGRNFPRTFVLWPKDCLPEAVRAGHFSEWKRHPIPGGGDMPQEPISLLAERYEMYVPCGDEPPALGDRFARAFSQLVEYTPGRTALWAGGRHIRIFIENRFVYTLKIPIWQPITPGILSTNPFPEMEYISRVVNAVTKLR